MYKHALISIKAFNLEDSLSEVVHTIILQFILSFSSFHHLPADHLHQCWKSSRSRTETSDLSSAGLKQDLCFVHIFPSVLLCCFSLFAKREITCQVIALCQAPLLLDDPNVGLLFPADAIARAKHYLALTSGGLGIIFNKFFIL